jgi:hypothetical protein
MSNSLCSALFAVAARSNNAECPKITIDCPTAITVPDQPYTVTANVEGSPPDAKVSYRWSINSGKIVEGQGTLSIKVVIEAGKPTTATLEIDGLEKGCQRAASCSFPIE